MELWVFSTWSTVDLSIKVERSRGKYRNAGHGYFALFSSGCVNLEFGLIMCYDIMDSL